MPRSAHPAPSATARRAAPAGARPLAQLVRDLTTRGAVTVATAFADRPDVDAIRTSIQLSGSVLVQVDPSLPRSAPEWAEHRRAIAARLAPLAELQRWRAAIEVIQRWLPIPAMLATFAGGTRLQDVEHRWGWALVAVGVALLLRSAARPLITWAIKLALQRALAAE